MLDFCLELTAGHLDLEGRKTCRKRLEPHPLLSYDAAGDHWHFKEDQIMTALLADQLVRWPSESISDFVSTIQLDPGAVQDLGEMIVDLAGTSRELSEAIMRLVSALSSGQGTQLAAVVALMAIERILPQGSQHSERAAMLKRLCGGGTVHDLTFTGTIARFDFGNLKFLNCCFENVTWANCGFNNRTVFEHCQFHGGVLAGRVEGFGSAGLIQCKLDAAATRCFNSARVAEGNRTYSVEDLRADLHGLMGKFITKGGIALKTVTYPNLIKGNIGASRHKEEIISAVIAAVLEEHHISGRTEKGYHIRPAAEEAVRFYAANNVFTGQLRDVFERLQKKLIKM